MKRAALLLRVSTERQARADRAGVDVQRAACLDYAARNGLDITGEYIDAVSGAHDLRPDFYRLLSEAQQFKAVVVFDLTRVARDEEVGHKYLRLMHESGLEVHSTNRGLVERSFLTSVDIAYGAEEKRKMAARMMGAKVQLAKRGELPQGVLLFGYRHVGRTAIVHPEEGALSGSSTS